MALIFFKLILSFFNSIINPQNSVFIIYLFYLLPDSVPFSKSMQAYTFYLQEKSLIREKLQFILLASFTCSAFAQPVYLCILSTFYIMLLINLKRSRGVVGGSSGSPVYCLQLGNGVQSLRAWSGAQPPVSSCWILYAVWNCWRIFQPISHFTAIYRPLLVDSI